MKKSILIMLFISITLLSCKKSAEEFVESGNKNFDLQKYYKAIEDYSLAIDADPNIAIAYNNRGLATIKLFVNVEEKATFSDSLKNSIINDYNKAIELNPNMSEAYNNKAIALIILNVNRQQEHPKIGDEIIKNINKAIEINPKYTLAYYNRAFASNYFQSNYYRSIIARDYFKDQNKIPSVIKDCSKAIALNPTFALSYIKRAEAKELLADYNGVIEDYTKALTICPKNTKFDLFFKRGSAKYSLKDFKGAIEDFNSSIKYTRNTKDSLYALKLRLYANWRINPNSDDSKAQSLFLTKFEKSKSYQLFLKNN
jgi:tetratricopeptide (TPR) repeat protein